jgi:hypothetical protein
MNVVSVKACKWCGRPMSNVAEIAPFGGGPGLVAFMCRHCGTTDSVLICEGHPNRHHTASQDRPALEDADRRGDRFGR